MTNIDWTMVNAVAALFAAIGIPALVAGIWKFVQTVRDLSSSLNNGLASVRNDLGSQIKELEGKLNGVKHDFNAESRARSELTGRVEQMDKEAEKDSREMRDRMIRLETIISERLGRIEAKIDTKT